MVGLALQGAQGRLACRSGLIQRHVNRGDGVGRVG